MGRLMPAARFGRGMLDQWGLDPEILYLNHGTVGAPPKRVLARQQAIRDEIERQPSRFMLRELTEIVVGGPRTEPPRMRVAAQAVAEFLGARGEDLVFVDNATTGVNALLRSFDLRSGDEILVTDHAYGAVARTAEYVARTHDASVRTIEIPYPLRDPGEVVEAIVAGIGPRTRLAVVDHITSSSALVFPLAEIAAGCRARGVAILADAAHAPGAIVLDVPAIGVDWYVGNLHKWLYSPRSSGILWAPASRQTGLHPTVISWGLDQSFTAEFDLVGTRDPSAHLAAPEGVAFMNDLGAEAVRAYNHQLAWEGALALSARWRTELGMPESMVGTMATLPMPASLGSEHADAARVRDALLYEDRIEAQVHAWRGRLWARISGQVYVEMADIERLGEVVLRRA